MGSAEGSWSPEAPDRLIEGGPAELVASGTLRLTRDAIGHRSLFWSRRPDGVIVFGPTLRSVLARDPRRELDRDAVAWYLACAYVPNEATLLRHVRAVPAGVELTFGAGEPEARAWWSLPAEPADPADEATLRRCLRGALAGAIDRALPDGPVAATLSGGIDSSLVVALAAQRRPVRTLSVTFGPDWPDELAWSGRVAAHLGVRQDIVPVTPQDVVDHLDATMEALSVPNGDPLTVPNHRLFAAAAGEVVLNGEGGDPCFGGPKNAPMLLASLYDGGGPAEAWLSAHQRCFDELDRLSGEPGLSARLARTLDPWFVDPRWSGLLNRVMAMNIALKGPWHILPKVEQLAACHGASPRSPLFDREIVELSMEIPAALKRRGSVEKHLLKEAVRDLLPDDVVDRPKSGMMVPVEGWFTGPLLPFARERLLDGLAPWGLVDRRWMEHLLDRRASGLRPRRGIKVWLLVALEAWLRRVVGR